VKANVFPEKLPAIMNVSVKIFSVMEAAMKRRLSIPAQQQV